MISKKKKTALSIAAVLLLIVGGFLLWFPERSIVETVKKQTAKLFVYEYIPSQKIAFESTQAYQQRDSIYTDFRKHFRFHYQTIGLANFADSSKLMLIAEPPPYFVLDSLKSIFSNFKIKVEIRQHPIGYDGRISDILITMVNATDENVKNIVQKLSKRIYFSDYKAHTTALPIEEKRIYFSASNLDYQISLEELNNWFIENQEPFITLNDTAKTWTVPSLLHHKKTGVYFSKIPGFVIWAIAKKSDLSLQIGDIRQFTLDADLILGAISDSTTLLIIGRERETKLNELPPLNVETILLLASITEKELSQSLDINDLCAGKMKNGKDWCPTYLSKELENTEFGHLLTITDILLKDWSEKGSIQEANYRYPEPGYYPFDKPLFKKLGINELVYNWNTANTMYAIDKDNKTIYSLNRTGALPVSYFNSQERSESIGSSYENKAYYYFATLGNTDLARVVQYTAIYQLFIDNHITYSTKTASYFPKNKPYLLLNPTKKLLSIFKSLNDNDIQNLSDSITRLNFEGFEKEKVEKQLAENQANYHFTYTEQQINEIYNNVKQNNQQYVIREFETVRNLLNNLSAAEFEKLARYLSYPRGTKIYNGETYLLMLKSRKVNHLLNSINKSNLYLLHFDLNDIKNYYVSNLSTSSAPYVKTPSIIITFNDFYTTGGHNLSSKINRVNSMTHYKKATYTPPSDERTEKPVQETAPKTSPQKTSYPSVTTKKSIPSKSSKASVTNTSTQTKKSSTRPRSAVISSAPRSQRGF